MGKMIALILAVVVVSLSGCGLGNELCFNAGWEVEPTSCVARNWGGR